MARRARKESSTGMYHVIVRGNNRNWITRSTQNKRLMKNLIMKQVNLELIEVYAWCIMDNHVHMVIRSEKDNMSKPELFMRLSLILPKAFNP